MKNIGIIEEIERLKQVEKEHQRINGKLREENKKLNNINEFGFHKELRNIGICFLNEEVKIIED